MALFGFFKRLGKKLGGLLISFLKSGDVKALLKTAEGKLVAAVVAEVQDIVGLSSAQKREEALKRISEKAKGAGIELKDSVASLLLEIVIAKAKATIS